MTNPTGGTTSSPTGPTTAGPMNAMGPSGPLSTGATGPTGATGSAGPGAPRGLPAQPLPPFGNIAPEHKIAIEAVHQYNRKAQNLRVIKSVELRSAGGLLCLVEFDYGNDEENYWPVVVRGNNANVYYDWEFAIADATSRRWFFDFFSPEVVLALLSLGILTTVIIMFFYTSPHEVPQVFAAALTTVLGFWFGRATK